MRKKWTRAAPEGLEGLVGRSGAMEQVREQLRTAARIDAHVLLEGETGTGKEVVARATGRDRAFGSFLDHLDRSPLMPLAV